MALPLAVFGAQTPVEPAGVIQGRVLNETGEPMVSIAVRALSVAVENGRRVTTTVQEAKTNDRGEYRLFALTPSSYILAVIPEEKARVEGDSYVKPTPANSLTGRPAGTLRMPVSLATTTGRDVGAALDERRYVRVYFPHSADADGAELVDIEATTLFIANFQIARVIPAHVRGHVTSRSTGQAPLDISITLRPTNSVELRTVQGNNFDFSLVPPGSYLLTARSRGGTLLGSMAIEVGKTDLDNIELAIDVGGAPSPP